VLKPFWRRSRVSTRIVVAIVLSMIAGQGLTVLQFELRPEPQWGLYGLRWLVAATEEAATVAFAAPPEERADALKGLASSGWLLLTWRPDAPRFGPDAADQHPFGERMEATLRQTLGTRVKSIVVTLSPQGPPGRHHEENVAFRPPELEMTMPTGPMKDGEPEIAIPGRFCIAVQGLDQTWLTVGPPYEHQASPLWRWPLLPLFGGTLTIAAISLFTARRVLAPLEGSTRAVQRLGVERKPEPIASQGLGEFSAIAEAFNDMQSRLKRFVDDRTQILAAMSHDLRTSLTRLSGLPRRELSQSAERVKRDLLIIPAELRQEVSARAFRQELVARELRQIDKGVRATAREAEAITTVLYEQGRSKTEGESETRRSEVEKLRGVRFNRAGVQRDRNGLTDGKLCCCVSPRAQRRHEIPALFGRQVESSEVGVQLRWRDDATLVRP
jgi:hypothetical protein